MMLQRRLSYWLTQVYVDPYWNMQVWCENPSARNQIHDIELVQNSAICFISNLKRRTDNVLKVKNQSQLKSLKETPTVLFDANTPKLRSTSTPSTAYDKIARDRQLVTVTYHAAAREPISDSRSTKKCVFHTSFMPQTIREMHRKNS